MTTRENNHKVDRGGTTKYVLANLVVMVAVFAVILLCVGTVVPGPWWKWLLISPVAFFAAGLVEERLLSGFVSRLVKALFEKQR